MSNIQGIDVLETAQRVWKLMTEVLWEWPGIHKSSCMPAARKKPEERLATRHQWAFNGTTWKCEVCPAHTTTANLTRDRQEETYRVDVAAANIAIAEAAGHRLASRCLDGTTIVLCRKCGAHSEAGLSIRRGKLLARKCEGVPKHKGSGYALKCSKKGFHPRSRKHFDGYGTEQGPSSVRSARTEAIARKLAPKARAKPKAPPKRLRLKGKQRPAGSGADGASCLAGTEPAGRGETGQFNARDEPLIGLADQSGGPRVSIDPHQGAVACAPRGSGAPRVCIDPVHRAAEQPPARFRLKGKQRPAGSGTDGAAQSKPVHSEADTCRSENRGRAVQDRQPVKASVGKKVTYTTSPVPLEKGRKMRMSPRRIVSQSKRV